MPALSQKISELESILETVRTTIEAAGIVPRTGTYVDVKWMGRDLGERYSQNLPHFVLIGYNRRQFSWRLVLVFAEHDRTTARSLLILIRTIDCGHNRESIS